MANVIFRTLVLFLALLLMLRLMGKRQIGQLQPYEFALTLIAADLVTTPMANLNTPLLWGILPIYVLLLVGLLLSLLSLSSARARRWICGKPRVLIDQGLIMKASLRAVRYTLNDLLEQLRAQGIFDPGQVYYAILETNGEISVIKKADVREVNAGDFQLSGPQDHPPVALVMDGRVLENNLTVLKRSRGWLDKMIRKSGFQSEKELLLLLCDRHKLTFYTGGAAPQFKEVPHEFQE